MTTLDLLYLTLIAITLLLDYIVLWPVFLRRSKADPGRARLWLWSGSIIMWWTVITAGLTLWLFEARSWEGLRFAMPHGWQLWGSICLVLLLVLALVIAYAQTVTKLAQRKNLKPVKIANLNAIEFYPHTPYELGWWVALSLTAGFCEEFIFRGYLIWAIQSLLGLWGAAAFSLVVFAVAHAYQGMKGILTAGALGGLLTLVVLILGSLWPAIALHALVDFGGGLVTWLALQKIQNEGEMVKS